MVNNEPGLEGKVAIVTGGSRGIGRATAAALAQAGADVVIASRKLPDLEAVAKEIGELFGRQPMSVPVHMDRKNEIENLINMAVNRFGKIDILVNNAGVNPALSSIIDMEERTWDYVMNVNLKGCFLLSQGVAKIMRERGEGGSIVNISSEFGIIPARKVGAYCVSKAGLIMLTKVMAHELGEYGIRVNAVAPGSVPTKLSQTLFDDSEWRAYRLEHTALGRFGEPAELASIILFLASRASSYMTGETLLVNGGYPIT